ncbi:hypothetical protein vBBak6_098 [Bacillus phage v_B-Bak6]|nr:hypothetical protein vBBak1_098 [Bacillus phage v_B-Bak1]AXY83178.1 hypothetical protein vBBak6_098 [Bacillus phage v_B-Bak6]
MTLKITISFTDEEEELYWRAYKQDDKSKYIKRLIKRDMSQNTIRPEVVYEPQMRQIEPSKPIIKEQDNNKKALSFI